jgi:hypothetical protein
MAVAAIGREKGDQRANAFDIGAVDDRTTVARATYQSRAGKYADVRRQRIVRAADRSCDRAGREPVRLGAHEQPENFEPRRLTKRRQGRERVRGRHPVAVLGRTDVADHGQSSFRQVSTSWRANRSTSNEQTTARQTSNIVVSRILDVSSHSGVASM